MKKKAMTFSYDDGCKQDARLIELFHKHGLKATFNLNSGRLGQEDTLLREGKTVLFHKFKPEEIRDVYAGHEVAAHTLDHAYLPGIPDDAEVIRQVEHDRLALSELVGYEVCGMAYPCAGQNNDDRTAKLIRENTGIKYARALATNSSFSLQENLFRFEGTCYHHEQWDQLFEIGERFLALQPEEPSIFYIWGHSFEFDIYPERWKIFDRFCEMMSGKDDIFYGTNKEVLLTTEWK